MNPDIHRDRQALISAAAPDIRSRQRDRLPRARMHTHQAEDFGPVRYISSFITSPRFGARTPCIDQRGRLQQEPSRSSLTDRSVRLPNLSGIEAGSFASPSVRNDSMKIKLFSTPHTLGQAVRPDPSGPAPPAKGKEIQFTPCAASSAQPTRQAPAATSSPARELRRRRCRNRSRRR